MIGYDEDEAEELRAEERYRRSRRNRFISDIETPDDDEEE